MTPTLSATVAAYESGFVMLTAVDPVEGGAMQVVVAYPTNELATTTTLGPFTLAAGRDSLPAPGQHPLIVFSHGTGGSAFGHHDSLTALARAGFVAAAVEHPRDNHRDESGFGTDLQLIGRAHHIVALIDTLLADKKFGPIIDRNRIGMVGHSAGGYTALVVAGARPDFGLAAAYRQAVPDDPYRARAEAAGAFRRKPDLQLVADPRVRAIVLMAPALGYMFDAAGLAGVKVPVRMLRPSNDELLPHPWHAEHIARHLANRPDYSVLDGAGHFVFLAPCSPSFTAMARQICTDPPGIDRTAVHDRLNADMIAFFGRSLGFVPTTVAPPRKG